MTETHIAELLIEVNKKISDTVTKIQTDHAMNKQGIIDNVNDVIRQLDKIVEHLERK